MPAGPPALPQLAAELAAKGVTQAQIADAVGVIPGTISAIIRGVAKPSAALRQRIADYLGVDDVDALFELNPDIRRLVESAVAQGFGRTIDDPAVLRKVVALSRATATK